MSAPAMWIVPHTHWDREWYEPHDVFRARLVAMLDELLGVLERDPDYRFTLDGQTAALEDYLAIRPDAADRVRDAVARGQLAIGPFQILLDEFCCDGETIVRNLELGVAAARRVGTEMRVGYLPDMFGHAAQMPQFLRGFGLIDAALWRGAPAAVDRHGFVWQALNGDAVRVEYLWDGYGSALKLFEPVEKLGQLVADYVDDTQSWTRGEPVAGMFGTDHMAPRADLADLLRSHNADPAATPLRMATLDEVIADRDHSDAGLAALPVVRGELRSHARGNLLPGVFSIRPGLKQAMAEAERALTTAERLDVWAGGDDRSPFFERGWGLVVESTAHDSVTGCGVDATAEQVESRLRVAAHTARGAIDLASRELASTAPVGSVAVFNQLVWGRPVLVEMVVEGEPTGQVIEELPTLLGDEQLAASDLPKLLRRIHGQELFGKHIRNWSWTDDALEFVVATDTGDDFDLDVFTRELVRRQGEDPGRVWPVRTLAALSARVLVAGWVNGLSSAALPREDGQVGDVVVDGATLRNSLTSVRVRDDGLVDVTDLVGGREIRGALGLSDEGDCGDSYNFGPAGVPVTTPHSVDVQLLEAGPLRARVLIRRTFDLPDSLSASSRDERSDEVATQVVDTLLELRADEPFVRVSVRLVNAARDHRLRVHVPTRQHGVETSSSAGQFGVTTRGRKGEGGWGEFPLPTFPATRFVHAGEVGVLVDRLVEYEVVDGDGGAPDEIALTVLRAVGLMSVNVHPLRDEPAGPQLPTPGAQYVGRDVELAFAIDLTCPDWRDSAIAQHSEEFRFDPVAVPGSGTEAMSRSIGTTTDGRAVLESLRRTCKGVEARFVNYLPTPERLGAVMPGRWDQCDLTGVAVVEDVDPDALMVPGAAFVTLRRRGKR